MEGPASASPGLRKCASSQGPCLPFCALGWLVRVPAGLSQSLTSLLFSWTVITAVVLLMFPGFQTPRQELLREATKNRGKMWKAEHLCSLPSSSTQSSVTLGNNHRASVCSCATNAYYFLTNFGLGVEKSVTHAMKTKCRMLGGEQLTW